jgi:hypothetical protein
MKLSLCLTAVLLVPLFADAQCTSATPTGAWGFNAQGFLSSGSLDSPIGEEGIIVFDGIKHITVNETFSNGGAITRLGPFTGTYSVNADCSFAMIFHDGVAPSALFSGFFVNGATEFRIVDTDAGVTLTGVGKLINNAACSDATPAGTWGFDAHGFVNASSVTSTPLALAGEITFDGLGHLVFYETYSLGGKITAVGAGYGKGVYVVNPDCSFTLTLHGEGPTVYYNGVFVNATEFLVVDATANNADIGSGKHQ